MSELYIDITELAFWQGKLTGVPRVMDELSRRFAGQGKPVFVVWDGFHRSYQHIEFIPEKLQSVSAQPTEPSSQPAARFSQLIKTANKIKQRSHVAAKALSVPERLARKILKPKPFAPTTSAANPNRGDKLLIMADWHSSDHAFVDYVLELKQRGVVLGQICYDMLPIITPQYSGHATDSFTNYVRKVYPVCDLVLAISNNTKKDIAEWLAGQNLNVPRIEVFRLGDDFKMSEPLQPENIFTDAIKKQDDFLLCVGTIEARKNHALLYYTYKLAAQRNIALPNLIIVGRRGWRSEDIYEIMKTDPITKSQFIFLENASDEELAWLYQNCKFSVYPSFYEGWGLPIAESITYGTPCVASNSSSMPEIAGDLIQYFSPASADECLATISDMLLPGNIDKAKQKLKSYNPISWDQTFEFIDKQIGEIGARND